MREPRLESMSSPRVSTFKYDALFLAGLADFHIKQILITFSFPFVVIQSFSNKVHQE